MSVIFDQLRISDDGKRMYINLHVNRADYFENIYLDEMVIIPADKVLETSPTIPSEDYIYKKVFDDGLKEADIVLLPTDFNEHFSKANFSHDLFFVYVKVKGTPDPCTPCRLDEEVTLGVTFDDTQLHQMVMGYTKDLLKDCNVPTAFTDFILQWNAFKAAIETEHYVSAIKFWSILFNGCKGAEFHITKPCGCHG